VSDRTRRQPNGTFYERPFIDEDPIAVTHDDRRPPFDEIRESQAAYRTTNPLNDRLAPTRPSAVSAR
jgi:hypothetical protein